MENKQMKKCEVLCKEGKLIIIVPKDSKYYGSICQLGFNQRYYKASKYGVKPKKDQNCSKEFWEKLTRDGFYYEKD